MTSPMVGPDQSPRVAAGSGPRVLLVSIYNIYATGLRYLQSRLRSAGYACDLVFFQDVLRAGGFRYTGSARGADYLPTELEYELLRDLIRDRGAEVVGIGFMSYALKWATRITEVARSAGAGMVVWGGPHPSLAPEECVRIADAVCVGDGEEALLELVECRASGRPFRELAGWWVREGERVYRNPAGPVSELDRLPPPSFEPGDKFFIARGRLENRDPYLDRRGRIQYLVNSSRGCPYHCSFCCNQALARASGAGGRPVRQRSTENIIAELKSARESLSVGSVGFLDENFSGRPGFYEGFFERYREEVGLPFTLELHPLAVSAEFCGAMRSAGGVGACIGVQTGSERARKELYDRPETNAQVLAAARAINGAGMLLLVDLIFNNPFETGPDLEATLALALSLPRPHVLKTYSLCYLPGAAITRRALEQGKIGPHQLDQHSQQGFFQMMATCNNALDSEQGFFITLCWLENLKLDLTRLELDFFITIPAGGPRAAHVFPRGLIRLLSRSRFLRRHPRGLHLALSWGLPAGNLALLPVRKSRDYLRRAFRKR